MHNTYYFFAALCRELQPLLTGGTLTNCFTQAKEELIVEIEKPAGGSFYIKANLQAQFTALSFPDTFNRQKRNSADLFPELHEKTIIGVRQFLNERTWAIEFSDNWALVFKMHGNRSNILLFEGDTVHSLFKNKLKNDFTLNYSNLDRPIDQSKEAFWAAEGDWKKLYPTFGPFLHQWVGHVFSTCADREEQWRVLQQIVAELNAPQGFFLSQHEEAPHISLLQDIPHSRTFASAREALNIFLAQYAGNYYFEREKSQLAQQLSKRLNRTLAYIADTERRLQSVQEAEYEKLGHILMANLHAIPAKSTEVELHNFYTERPIVIGLNKDLSPQKNAERYYRKAKNQKLEIKNLEDNLMAAMEKAELLQKLERELTTLEDFKSLKQWTKTHSLGQNEQDESANIIPYKEFIHQGFKIWVGRNAQANDTLTLHYAHKDDAWLHARDVSGSHVVIKHQSGKNFPKTVIERAAELAAWHSKRKNESLCPVIFTSKKYVRKPKGFAPGQVKVEKEEVIFVQPKA
ncbi:NFACT RNA binding domain-containing protein [Cytophagales bacterium LB-30]|uniref:NFACT RNA binding domain-containing protein n=1 Tax=Shiella aurantiaca TaxID=3058365 RepID=A0ABT8F3V6_9BACT|nr:NFACT RNA binding domain-containing protein [Shiella aurantiaca]MDN4164906.1 NFACT RNA binding domain-containing protein [Shiella aurantiaca]